MNDYRWNYHVPAFGSWDFGDDNIPYTQCFENARTYQQHEEASFGYTRLEDRDLYVAGDLCRNNFVAPAVIVVPRRRRKRGSGYSNVKGVVVKRQQQEVRQKPEREKYSYDIKEPPSQMLSDSPPKPRALNSKPSFKAVDEDLYKIPPEYLHVQPKRKKLFGFFTSCLLPSRG